MKIDIKEIAMHPLWEQRDIDQVCETKDYIVTNDAHKGIYVFDKNLVFVKSILLEQEFACHGFFVKFNENSIALIPTELEDHLWIIDIDTDAKQRIDLSSSGYIAETGFSDCYFWTNELFLIIDYKGNAYRIDVASGKVKQLTPDELKQVSPEFCAYIATSANYAVVNYFPQQLQFTYYDPQKSEIGFVDCKHDVVCTHAYASDDIHEIFFVCDDFIVTSCETIVHVGDAPITLAVPQYGQEFRGSILMADNHEILTFERYWKATDKRMFLRLLELTVTER